MHAPLRVDGLEHQEDEGALEDVVLLPGHYTYLAMYS
jgi:hypothetical protein